MPNLAKFRADPDAMLVMSLEEYDEATGRAEKSSIMMRDVVGPRPPVTHVTSAEEGLLASLNDRGGVDLAYIAGLYGEPEEAVVAELDDLIYRDPATEGWETADAYLSGDVRAKLAAAEGAGPGYSRNAEALRRVQPEDVLPGDIDANLGAPWIPADDIRAFAAELFGVPAEAFRVAHVEKDAVWGFEADHRAIQSVAATADFGTSRINGTELLSQALNMKTPAIYDVVRGPDGDQRVPNPTETLAAREKQKRIKERFKLLGLRRARTHRTPGPGLQRHLQQPPPPPLRRLAPGLPRLEPERTRLRPHQADADLAGDERGQHAAGPRRRGRQDLHVMAATGMKRKQAGLIPQADVRGAQPHARAIRPRVPRSSTPTLRLLVATKDDLGQRPPQAADGEDRQPASGTGSS